MYRLLAFALLIFANVARAQSIDSIIHKDSVLSILEFLTAKKLGGRGAYTPGLERSAEYIYNRFLRLGLQPLPGNQTYLQSFAGESVKIRKDSVEWKALYNVVAVLPGDSLPGEFIFFTAHYDHIGNARQVYPGANDNASGVAALLMLAEYYTASKINRRSIVFCAFSGEELGMLGSYALQEPWMNDTSVIAVINMEMLGIPSVGKNRFFLTGAHHSTLESIFKSELKESPFKIVQDPAPQQNMYERSDNVPFNERGIIAHTIMAGGEYPCYHQYCDNLRGLDVANLTRLIHAIARPAEPMIKGTATPQRR